MSVMKGKFLQGGREREWEPQHTNPTRISIISWRRFCSTHKLIKHFIEFRKLLPSVKWESQLTSEKMGSEPGTEVNNFGWSTCSRTRQCGGTAQAGLVLTDKQSSNGLYLVLQCCWIISCPQKAGIISYRSF